MHEAGIFFTPPNALTSSWAMARSARRLVKDPQTARRRGVHFTGPRDEGERANQSHPCRQ